MRSIVLLLLLMMGLGCPAQQKAPTYGSNSSAGRYVQVRGIRLYCEQYGKGAPLLLLHGNGGSISAFQYNIGSLSGRFHVIAVDSRAQGKSTDSGDSLSFEMMADDMAALLDSLHIPSCYVAGWSDGGIVALMMALRHPGRVKKLAATGANIFTDSTAFTAETWQQMQRGYQENRHTDFSQSPRKNDWKLFLLDYFQPALRFGDLRSISSPTLIIAGDRDVISLEHTTGIYRHLPKGQLWIVPDCGHATLIDRKDDFNRALVRFFLSGN